jgi:regulator of protease activity HflC (stomatin/prohibitin superfamily)
MSEIKFTTASSKPVNTKKVARYIGIAAIALVVLIVLFNSFIIVNEGFIGVKYRFGKIVDDDLTAGLNLKIPFIEEVIQVDIREQVYYLEADAYTSDTQTVNDLRVKLNYYYDSTQLSNIIRNIGVSNVESKIIAPRVASITKDEIGRVKAEELVQSRYQVQQKIQDNLTQVLSSHGIIVSSFAVENISFDEAFEASIQAKVIAAQEALKMENKTKEKEEEAKQIIIAAQARAESEKIAADAEAYAIQKVQEQLASSPNYIEYLKIFNWNGELPTVIGDGVNPFVVLDGGTSSFVTPPSQTQSSE